MPTEGDIIAGKYLLEKSLGMGGMGEVFQAVHQEIGKRVALKFLQARHSAMPKTVARFQREARMAAAAGHRGIVDIFDVGISDDGLPFMVMEVLKGQSLLDLIYPGRQLDIGTAAFIGCQVLSALAAAHGAGIVHRDLKPANIFLVDTGAALPDVKLLDFGISRLVGSGMPGDDQSMTQTGAVLGTPTYMSPEQAMGEKDKVDHRTDIYAMGVILFECTTGTLPFLAPNYNSLIVSIITSEPARPKELRPDLPEALEEIILKALAKDPADRHQSTTEMFQALLPYVDEASLSRIIMPPGSTLPRESSRLLARAARAAAEAPRGEGDRPAVPVPRTSPREATSSERSGTATTRRNAPLLWAAVGAVGAFVVIGGGFVLWSGMLAASSPQPQNPALFQPPDADRGGIGVPHDSTEADAAPRSTVLPVTGDVADGGARGGVEAGAADDHDDAAAGGAGDGHASPRRPERPPRNPGREPVKAAPDPTPPQTERGVYVD